MEWLSWMSDPQAWVSLATLTMLEIVLGVDNIIFLTILVNKVPPEQRHKTRLFGLALAMGTRILLLLSLAWVMRLTEPLVTIAGHGISGRDLILIGGGLFLLVKAVMEIHNELEGFASANAEGHVFASFTVVILQIAIIDIVFSLDSVITAIGMVNQVVVMVLAIVLAVAVMIFASNPVGDFIDRHPTLRMLALAFLILVGVVLIADGLEFHVPRGYVYFAMGFSIVVEMLNLMARRKAGRGT